MLPDQPTTGRYQLLDGPFTHLEGGGIGSNFELLMLEWFDTWLKHKHTGMAHTTTPLHYYDLGTGAFSGSGFSISISTPFGTRRPLRRTVPPCWRGWMPW